MTNRILHEAGTIASDPKSDELWVTLISEGAGSSADYPAEFFNEDNAARLAESMSFPGHPINLEAPEQRNPMTAIGQIGSTVLIETDASGKKSFRAQYFPTKSDPKVAQYLKEYAPKLGLSIYSDSTGHQDTETGRWIAESLVADDPYRSVDVVVAPGARGKFERVAEGLRRVTESSATAEVMKKENEMATIEEVQTEVGTIKTVLESLVAKLDAGAKPADQVEPDAAAVTKAVEARLDAYDEAVELINGAKLTESQAKSLRALAKTGVDITEHVESAKAVLAEAAALVGKDNGADTFRVSESYSAPVATRGFGVAGFGQVG